MFWLVGFAATETEKNLPDVTGRKHVDPLGSGDESHITFDVRDQVAALRTEVTFWRNFMGT